MHREPDPDGPELPDDRLVPDPPLDEFDAIVAGWRADGDVPRWPDEPDGEHPEPGDPRLDVALDTEVERLAAPLFDPPATPPPAASPEPASIEPEDEHFVPPEPPPLPRIGPPALVGLTLIVLGIVLIAAPGWIGVPTPYGVPLGLVSIASGLGWLVLRLWPDHSDHSDGSYDDGLDEDDDGAVL
ncbi:MULTISPECIES: hypothetical protein [unclassified Pseudonocardia]|uniref:hypothetical protein n=1 Tax=unclassified Pseudonocardia TaxID=2619320 RepID=UPI000969538E|nr:MULTISPECIES: hypothetical protein [unclassified Pseudonocardia]MBN9100365.1 hypothetical protein [Pseudonocardia sp.]OJY50115.1 MAG: hypothetical protein BGP03_24940 [Pseudonocardia sp. 73-21]